MTEKQLRQMVISQEQLINGHKVVRTSIDTYKVNGNGPFDFDTSVVIVNKVRSANPDDKSLWILLGIVAAVLVIVVLLCLAAQGGGDLNSVLASLMLLLIITGGVAFAVMYSQNWTQPSKYVTRENFLRIQRGMNTTEVEAILGKPTRVTPIPGNEQELWEYVGPPLIFKGEQSISIYIHKTGFVVDKIQRGLGL